MKIDVEGFEPAVVAGALGLFREASSFGVLVEIFPELLASWQKTPSDIIEPLKACGADRVVRIPDGGSREADDNFYNVLITKGRVAAELADSVLAERRP
jgi:hypothetical protein